ncbi:AbrB family transcriptional regulator [Aliiroseovarius sp. KMU-50]|uniref:AbrB family transcriptional regulator n=1 Tax=Aliiroseovarius salicola TaxID=3009082 RepID=A0ABT4W3Z5_9RHOB|nr:AbrB family transcriptional regulator [Aliiroseovarius sp. KMU-50]MDA5095242.1 AbrB family transcriptional regulator [Aliiroseovarius sp. KMU-50]
MMVVPADLRQTALTICVGAVGAAFAWAINMPLGLLAGPALAVAFASVMGMKTAIAMPLRNVIFVLVGIAVGSMVTPTSIAAIARWPLAFAILACLTAATPFVGQRLLTRHMGFSRTEGFLSAAPGHLSLVVSLADTLNIALTRPALLASFRVLAISLFVPLAARLSGLELGPGLPVGRAVSSWPMIGIELVAAIAIAPLLAKARLPAPVLLAAMITAAALHLGGIVDGNLPPWISQSVLVLMGCLIGTRFVGIRWPELRRNLIAGVIVVTLTTGLAAMAALPAAWISGLPLLDILVGFAPGGLETMVIVGVAMGADPSFVATAHVVRLVLLALVITTYAAHIARSGPTESNGQDRPPRAD